MPSELHPSPPFPFTIIPPHNDPHGNKLADSLSFPKQLTGM
jgi:hypothetical protein